MIKCLKDELTQKKKIPNYKIHKKLYNPTELIYLSFYLQTKQIALHLVKKKLP